MVDLGVITLNNVPLPVTSFLSSVYSEMRHRLIGAKIPFER